MLTFAYYLLKVIICSGILYGYYLVALRNKIFHRWNRFYLLCAIVLSLAVPLIKINLWQNGDKPATQVIHLLQVVSTGDEFVYEYSKNSFHIDATNLSIFIYTLVSVFLLGFLIQTLLKINRLKKNNRQTIVEGVNFINTNAKGTPFSFFNNIFWNDKIDLNTATGKQIFQHEVAHVQEKHSYDKIFTNVVLIFFWCNPFFWLIRKELNIIHEFIADKKALEDSDTAAFAAMILQATYPQQQFTITNNFFYSPLKRRLAMLTKNKNPKINYVSRLLVMPLAVLVFFAFTLKIKSEKSVNDVYKNARIKEINAQPNDTIPHYYKGRKIKEAYGSNKLNKAIIIYTDGRSDTISINEAEQIRIIPPPPTMHIEEDTITESVKTKEFTNNTMSGKSSAILVKRADSTNKILQEEHTVSNENNRSSIGEITAAEVIFDSEGLKKSNRKDGIIIINGQIQDIANLKNKIVKAKKGKIYPPNNKEAIELYGEAAKEGAMVFTDATITDKIYNNADTIPKNSDKVFTKVEIEPAFPGGEVAWHNYITKVMKDNIDELVKENKPGTCRVHFIVDVEGNVSNVEALTMKGTKLGEVSVNAIRKGPRWIPATQNGHKVTAFREQPITFAIQEETTDKIMIKEGDYIFIHLLRGNKNVMTIKSPINKEGGIFFKGESIMVKGLAFEDAKFLIINQYQKLSPETKIIKIELHHS